MMVKVHQKIEKYLDGVCSYIKCKEIHTEIRLELQSHLEEIAEEYIATGMSEDEAINRAILHSGDMEQIGRKLHEAHKPRTNWKLITLILTFICIGLLSMFSLSVSSREISTSIFLKQTIYIALGIMLATALFFFDYRKTKKYGVWLYAITLGFMIYSSFGGVIINGQYKFEFLHILIDQSIIGLFLLVISLAGIFATWNWKKKSSLPFSIFLLIFPMLVFLQIGPYLSEAVLYMVGFLVLLVLSKAPKKQVYIIFALLIGGTVFLISQMKEYQWSRLQAFFNPEKYPNESYQTLQSIEAIRSAGFLGHGFSAPLTNLPVVESDFIFTYIVYIFGWGMGMVFIVLTFTLFFHLFKTVRLISDPYGKLLISGLSSLLAGQFVWNLLMTIGMALPTSISLPFISYKPWDILMQLVAVGLILSVYRRKDMVSREKNIML